MTSATLPPARIRFSSRKRTLPQRRHDFRDTRRRPESDQQRFHDYRPAADEDLAADVPGLGRIDDAVLSSLLGENVQVAPTVTTNPASQSANAGTTATFAAAAAGNPMPTVQWEVNTGSGFTKASDSSVYSGSSTGTLTILDATGAMSGYQYEAVFTNSVVRRHPRRPR